MKRILVAENERKIAKEISKSLQKMGYDGNRVVLTGDDAIREAEESRPDLVLIDTVLGGAMSGTEVGQRIMESLDIPVIFIADRADERTLTEAKLTLPYGYVLKPLREGDLKASIQIAIYKKEVEKIADRNSKWIASALNSVEDAIITVDIDSAITFMNFAAEQLIRWKRKNALGKGLSHILNLKSQKTQKVSEIPINRALRNGVVISSDKDILRLSEGREVEVSYNVFPIRERGGTIVGAVMQLRKAANRNLDKPNTAVHEQGRTTIATEVVPISAGIVSTSSLVREGLRRIVEAEDDIEIWAEASNLFEMMSIINRKHLDVLLIDTSIPDLDLVKIQQSVSEDTLDTKILLLLHTVDEEFIVNAIYLGVQGYVKQTSIPSQLIDAIRSIKKDEIWAERDVLAKVLKRVLGTKQNNLGLLTSSLTLREKEIVELIALGFSNKHISQELSISVNTVKNHLANIFTKLGISKRLQLRNIFTS